MMVLLQDILWWNCRCVPVCLQSLIWIIYNNIYYGKYAWKHTVNMTENERNMS